MTRKLAATIAAFFIATPLWAHEARAPELHLQKDVPPAVFARWQARPQDVLDEVITIAFSFGSANAVTEDAIETAILEGRAAARARAVQDLLGADLNGDLAVTRSEIDAVDLARSGYARGLLWTRFRHANSDGDEAVSFEELRAYSVKRAKQFLSDGRADGMRALMAMDINGDGQVTVEEAEGALKSLVEGSGQVTQASDA